MRPGGHHRRVLEGTGARLYHAELQTATQCGFLRNHREARLGRRTWEERLVNAKGTFEHDSSRSNLPCEPRVLLTAADNAGRMLGCDDGTEVTMPPLRNCNLDEADAPPRQPHPAAFARVAVPHSHSLYVPHYCDKMDVYIINRSPPRLKINSSRDETLSYSTF